LLSEAQVLWYGDQRAYQQPAITQGFFDLVYTEDCPQGLESNAIPRYAYFGPLISSSFAKDHADCLTQCLRNRRCIAVNYFQPLSIQLEGYCELLSESQMDNPKQMRPYRYTTYYDSIKCPQDQPNMLNEYLELYKPYDSAKIFKRPERLQQKKYGTERLKKRPRFYTDYRQ
uniref:Apple domain-containing protein n=1 Tax=Syphacia muris TaxID=451379 RepID=A0A158R5U4_9BILA